jgi:hypothetical protein
MLQLILFSFITLTPALNSSVVVWVSGSRSVVSAPYFVSSDLGPML